MVAGHRVVIAALLAEPDAGPAALNEHVPGAHLEHSRDAGERVDHEDDRGAVAEPGELHREVLAAVLAKSLPATRNAAIARNTQLTPEGHGASIVREERRLCNRAADLSTLTVPGWPKREIPIYFLWRK